MACVSQFRAHLREVERDAFGRFEEAAAELICRQVRHAHRRLAELQKAMHHAAHGAAGAV